MHRFYIFQVLFIPLYLLYLLVSTFFLVLLSHLKEAKTPLPKRLYYCDPLPLSFRQRFTQ